MEINNKIYDTALGAVEAVYSGNAANWLKDFTHWVESIFESDRFWYNYRTKKVMYKSQIWDFVRMVRKHPEAYSQLKNWLENASCDDANCYINDIRFIDRIKDDVLLFEGVLA